MEELEEVKRLRLLVKAVRPLVRDLAVALARAEEVLERQAHPHNAQPQEAQRGTEDITAERCVA